MLEITLLNVHLVVVVDYPPPPHQKKKKKKKQQQKNKNKKNSIIIEVEVSVSELTLNIWEKRLMQSYDVAIKWICIKPHSLPASSPDFISLIVLLNVDLSFFKTLQIRIRYFWTKPTDQDPHFFLYEMKTQTYKWNAAGNIVTV